MRTQPLEVEIECTDLRSWAEVSCERGAERVDVTLLSIGQSFNWESYSFQVGALKGVGLFVTSSRTK